MCYMDPEFVTDLGESSPEYRDAWKAHCSRERVVDVIEAVTCLPRPFARELLRRDAEQRAAGKFPNLLDIADEIIAENIEAIAQG